MNKQFIVWRVFILIVSIMFLLVLFIGILIAPADADETPLVHSYKARTINVLGTPTVDPTVTALEKEQLTQEINKLKIENMWSWTTIGTFGSILAALVIAAYNLYIWHKNRRDEEVKRDDDRFQTVVSGLGSERKEARVGAAIMLRTFLRPGYEQFYRQIFDLAVAHLQLRSLDEAATDTKIPIPLDSLSHSLITVFKESFLLVRGKWEGQQSSSEASNYDQMGTIGIQLDDAYLVKADLRGVWLREAFLRKAHLFNADFTVAHLKGADFTNAYLAEAKFIRTDLSRVNFSKSTLIKTDFTAAELSRANFTEANLTEANLTGANLVGANLETATFLKNAKMSGVQGLTYDQREACVIKGAIFDGSEQLTTPI